MIDVTQFEGIDIITAFVSQYPQQYTLRFSKA